MPWFGRTRATQNSSTAPDNGARTKPGLPLDADARLKELLLRQDLEMRDLEEVQAELVSTLLSLMNAIGQLTGAGFHVTPLVSEARSIKTREEAVALRESLRNLLFESCVTPIHGDERENLLLIAGMLFDQLVAGVGDWGGLGQELRALATDVAREENRGQLDAAVTKLRDLLFRVSVLSRGLVEERNGLRELVTTSLDRLQGIQRSLGAAGSPPTDFESQVAEAFDVGNLDKARALLEREGRRLADEVRRVGAARDALAELLAKADGRVRGLATALDRTEVPVDVDCETGLGNQRALEALLADPASHARWVLAVRVENAIAIRDRYGAAALGRVLKAVSERVVPLTADALGHFRVGPATLAVVFAGEVASAARAKATAIVSAVEQTKFLFRTDVVAVRCGADVVGVSPGGGAIALLGEPGPPC
jgi:GGDEF domain-containing protein